MNSCPNKASKEWKTLVDQVGEDLSWATWAYYGYNYPATLNNVSSLKRALSIKSPCSENQYLKLAERVTKYNNKYGTAHSFTPVQVGQADLYDIDLKINYLPKKVVIKTVYQGDNSVLGNEYTKAFINNNPEVFISEGNQYIINGEVYGSYEDAINSSLDYDRPFAEKLFRNYEKDFIPADKDKVYELLALAKNQGISGVLNHIISNTKDPIIKIFAKAFLDNIDRAGFLQIKFDVARDRYGNYVQDASGSYGGGIININWKKVFFNATNLIHKNGLDSGYKSIIHELVHVYTLQALRNPKTSKEKEFKNKITKAYNTLKQDAAFKSDYGLSSVEEFISEIISNPEFRGTLNIYKAGFLAKIINYIAKLFGYTKDISMEESNRASIIHETVNTFLKDLPYLTPSKGKSIYYDKVNNIKPGVSELFESNPELANQIYEALGFQGSISLESNLKNTGKTEKELTDYLKNKYPEIKLNISNNPIWEQSSDIVKNQEEYNKEVQYRLKATEILLSDKAKQVFNKGNKNKWSLDKILSELAIPKEQKQIILDLNDEDYSFANFDLRESIILALSSNYSYAVEINTAKDKIGSDYYGKASVPKQIIDRDGESVTGGKIGQYWVEFINNDGDPDIRVFDTFEEANKAVETQQGINNSTVYSNLTVPGGTNYTENEISTPLITPSIKGHAQFSTDNGIGWFRSDEQSKNIKLAGLHKEWQSIVDRNGTDEELHEVNQRIWDIENKGENTKTRRILEIQSDLFQKGRDKEDLTGIPTNKVTTANLFDNEEFSFELNGYEYEAFVENIYYEEENQTEPTTVYYKNGVKISNKEMQIAKEEYKKQNIPQSQNRFLQLLNKDNNWVTFFIKSIIQDSAKKGYEKVLFPKGETAAKIEGHETLAERLRVIDKELSLKDKNYFIVEKENDVFGESSVEFDSFDAAIKFANDNTTNKDIWNVKTLYKITPERVKELEKKKQEIESQGIEKLKPIEAFYEIKVGNILEKQFGKDNVKTITDEYGNQWREISINQSRDLDNILLQKNEANRIIGQANIKAMTVLVDAVNKKEDTIPHEYAHHYIAWFRNTPIVQEAIKRFGSEEALVQAIGEQVVKQKGEAYNWWKKFTNWILNLLSDKQLLQVLTDSFLNRQDLHDFTYNQPNTQQKQQAQQLYSQYLDQIFPNSVVKDIVYHGTSSLFDNFSNNELVKLQGLLVQH